MLVTELTDDAFKGTVKKLLFIHCTGIIRFYQVERTEKLDKPRRRTCIVGKEACEQEKTARHREQRPGNGFSQFFYPALSFFI